MQMDIAHKATPKQRSKKFRSSKGRNQNERGDGLAGMMCKLLSQKSALMLTLTYLMATPGI